MKNLPLQVTVALMVIVAAAGTAYYFLAIPGGRRILTVSTTTSLYDTGVLDLIEEKFEEKHPIDLHFISVGTGLAIQYAKRGDADAILVHAPSEELRFLTEGYGVDRKIIAYNFFVIVGPRSDPAKIRGLNVKEALKRIVSAGRVGEALWVSRGDESGTHMKEKELWFYAGFNWALLREEKWFLESGSGMGKTLLIADERDGYTLADVGTYLKYYGDNRVGLEILVDKGRELLNVYSVIAVNPSKVEGVNFEDAVTFIKFLTSDECQSLIGNYKREVYGRCLFYPVVHLLRDEPNSEISPWIRDFAFFNGTECPAEYRMDHLEFYGG